MSNPPLAARVRPSTIEDYDGIAAVWKRSAFQPVSREDYVRRWSENPFRVDRDEQSRVITGWVVEAGDRSIVGTFGNIYQGYELNGEPLLGAVTHSVAVDLDHRRNALPLYARFFAQRDVPLLLATTANQTAGKVFTGFKGKPMPRADYDQVMYWITGYRGFARAALHRRGRPAAVAPLAAGALWLADIGRWAALPKMSSRIRLLDDFDDRFETFWQTLRQSRDRLLAVRSVLALRWHYREATQQGRLRIVALEETERLIGYCMLIRRDANDIGLRRYDIADLQLARPDAQDVGTLLRGAIDVAKSDDVHVIEAMGFAAFKHQAIEALRPRRRNSPCFPFLYKAQTAALAEQLAQPDAWDPCPYDGDAAF